MIERKRRSAGMQLVWGTAILAVALSARADTPAPKIQTANDMAALYRELLTLQKESEALPNEKPLRDRADLIYSAFAKATSSDLRDAVVSTLKLTAEKLPPNLLSGGTSAKKENGNFTPLKDLVPVKTVQVLGALAAETKNEAAIPVLWEIADKGGVPAEVAVQAIGSFRDPKQVQTLLRRLMESSTFYASVKTFGPAAVMKIAETVDARSTTPIEKRRLLAGLRRSGSRETLPTLDYLLDVANPEIATAASSTLGRLLEAGDNRIVLHMLNHKNEEIRSNGIGAVMDKRLWDEGFALPVLKILSKDPNDGIRMRAALLLGGHQTESITKALTSSASNDKSELVRNAAQMALKEKNGRAN